MINILIFIVVFIVFIMVYNVPKNRLNAIMYNYDLNNCIIYYNNTHAYIDTPDGRNFIFAHNSKTLPIIKKYHPL